MAQYFKITNRKQKEECQFKQKRRQFSKQIRQKEIQQKFKRVRVLGSDGPHIQAMIQAMPLSLPQIKQYLIDHHEYHQPITKLIINKIYHKELSEQSQSNHNDVYRLIGGYTQFNRKQLDQEIYLFTILVENQGQYAPLILKRYFNVLLQHAKIYQQINCMFTIINMIVSKPQLNWVPLEQIIQLIYQTQIQQDKQSQSPQYKQKGLKKLIITTQQFDTYYHLSRFYYPILQQTQEIRNRIMRILQYGDKCFGKIKAKKFFKFCLQLTYYQNDQTNQSNNHNLNVVNNQPNQSHNPLSQSFNNEMNSSPNNNYYNQKDIQIDSNNINEANYQLQNITNNQPHKYYFYQAMIKGKIVQNIHRKVFYSNRQNLRCVCLQVLRNIVIQFGGQFLWRQQKFYPIEYFQTQIKDTNNSMNITLLFAEVLLLSILRIPPNQIHLIFNSPVDIMDLIQYILQNITNKFNQHSQLISSIQQVLQFFIQYGNQQIKNYVSNKIINSQFKNYLPLDSQIVVKCEQKLLLK